jgi:hypothetical protein
MAFSMHLSKSLADSAGGETRGLTISKASAQAKPGGAPNFIFIDNSRRAIERFALT